jgi:hypothetical protein
MSERVMGMAWAMTLKENVDQNKVVVMQVLRMYVHVTCFDPGKAQ